MPLESKLDPIHDTLETKKNSTEENKEGYGCHWSRHSPIFSQLGFLRGIEEPEAANVEDGK